MITPDTTTQIKDSPCNMHFTLAQDKILHALELVMKSIPSSRRYPEILFNVLIRAESDYVTLNTTDLSTAISIRVAAWIERTGVYTTNAKMLHKCVKSFPKSGDVTLEVKEEQVVVTCGKRSFSLKEGDDGTEFPALPDVQMPDPLALSCSVLRQAIKEVEFSAADNYDRPIYAAICMHVRETSMDLVACDGRRMAVRTLPLPEVGGRDTSILIPVQSLRLLVDVMPKDGEISISWDEDRAAFICGHLRLVTRLIEGTFPNYAYRVTLSKSPKTKISLERSDFVSLLSAFKPATRDSSDILQIFYTSEAVTFKAKSDSLDATEELVTVFEGEDGYVKLNAEHIADVLKAIEDPVFTLSLSGYGHPCVMVPASRKDCRYLLMPFDPGQN
jgi:DNA polymerase-3 subunit beta